MVARRFGKRPPREGVLDIDAYLFSDITAKDGRKHWHTRVDVFVERECPMGKKAYGHYLMRFRQALVECAGVLKKDAKEYGTHMLRLGGENWLFDNNVPAQRRREIGGWLTPVVEHGYLRIAVKAKFDFMRDCGI